MMRDVTASFLPKEAREHCSSVVIGEGELFWPEVLREFEKGCLQPFHAQSPPDQFDLRGALHVANNFRREQSLALKCKRGIVASQRVNPMDCPHCHNEFPEKHKGRFCPHCGVVFTQVITPLGTKKDLAPPPIVAEQPPKQFKINLWVFFGTLLAPPLLTMLVVLLSGRQTNEQLSPFIAFFGGAGAGITCGVMLALRLGKSTGARLGLGVLFAGIFVVIGILLSFFGCMAAGYTFNPR